MTDEISEDAELCAWCKNAVNEGAYQCTECGATKVLSQEKLKLVLFSFTAIGLAFLLPYADSNWSLIWSVTLLAIGIGIWLLVRNSSWYEWQKDVGRL